MSGADFWWRLVTPSTGFLNSTSCKSRIVEMRSFGDLQIEGDWRGALHLSFDTVEDASRMFAESSLPHGRV